ncbi:MAG TPA: hypothetical protein VG432_10125 [Gemmatimonadaceae bacterium]|nr:hypothetical protein [Gemmatimonadaceae bacterium]
MPFAVRAPDQKSRPESRERAGDVVSELARGYAARMNDCGFAHALRERRISREQWISFISALYPAVVGFNRALILSIAKVDHVRNSVFLGALAEQLKEEQAHNQLWREKLKRFGIDHEKLYSDLESYRARFTAAELDAMTAKTLAAVTDDLSRGDEGNFPDAIVPDAVLALCHLLGTSATNENVGYWEHFASQAGIEMVIWGVVSATVLPGVLGNPELDIGPVTTQWLREHGQIAGAKSEARTDEEKHLDLSRIALNRSEEANADVTVVGARAENAMRLFAASFICQEQAVARFPLGRYRERAA